MDVTSCNGEEEGWLPSFCCRLPADTECCYTTHEFPPTLEDIWDAIGELEAKIWSVIDLTSSFWQMPLASNSKHKTAFVTQTGAFQWTRMPFGLRNAPVSFQKLMSDWVELSGGFTPCRHLRPSSGREHTIVTYSVR